jgi:D-alanyl-D-alanine carboxypeptidase
LILAASCLLLLFCGCRSPIKPLPPKETRSYQSLLEWSHQSGMPGAILLVRTPTTNFLGSVGWADKKRKSRCARTTRFRIGSVTKTLTWNCHRAASYRRASQYGFGDDQLSACIHHQPHSQQRPHHRSAIGPAHKRDLQFQRQQSRTCFVAACCNRRGTWPPMRELKYAFDKPARFPPGEGWEYSNSNFLLLGLIIDQITGHHHSVEIRQRILDPLLLTNSYYELSEPARGELAHGYEKYLGFSEDTDGLDACRRRQLGAGEHGF